MEFLQIDSGVEGSHVEHDVSICELQHLVSVNRHVILQFCFSISLSKIHFTIEDLQVMERS